MSELTIDRCDKCDGLLNIRFLSRWCPLERQVLAADPQLHWEKAAEGLFFCPCCIEASEATRKMAEYERDYGRISA